ncbi:MAG: FAD-linked oxidase C-terminal domain-containing protein [Bacteroidales bacterium]
MDILRDNLTRVLYATDASAYREIPYGVCFPAGIEDIRLAISVAGANGISLIPRTAGTSIAGQVVGSGLVADVSKYMNRILEINKVKHWARVQPGVVLDKLNLELAKSNLFFGPETSTANRCCIGGMVGNNSGGSHSLIYGTTRANLLEVKVVLGDGTLAVFSKERAAEVIGKIKAKVEEYTNSIHGGTGKFNERALAKAFIPVSLEERIYWQLFKWACDENINDAVVAEFPDKEIVRRNSGYALDEVLNDMRSYLTGGQVVPNLCKLFAGSEGTLAFAYEFKINLVPLPPKDRVLVCAHCKSLDEAFAGNIIALAQTQSALRGPASFRDGESEMVNSNYEGVVAIELIDDKILQLSKNNIEQNKNRFFVHGDPAAILCIEIAGESREEVDARADKMEANLKTHNCGYEFPRVYGADIKRVWELRKAGLGLLSGMPGDAKPVSLIEDTAVSPKRLAEYIKDIKNMLDGFKLSCVFYGHISVGELHLRPILNLKEVHDRYLFKAVAEETARIVKKYRGSLSGEHGDGRLRGEFLPVMFGPKVYKLFKDLKSVWDPHLIFNEGKIVNTPPMDTCLRYEVEPHYVAEKYLRASGGAKGLRTYFDFTQQKGLFCAIEQCNGNGDCRRPAEMGGVICPAFKAGKEERFSTRARANMMREVLTNGSIKRGATHNLVSDNVIHNSHRNPFLDNATYELLNECLSCKACKSECPSNVDMTRLKAEFLQHRFDAKGVPFRNYIVAHMPQIEKLGSPFATIYNVFASWKLSSGLIKKVINFSPDRSIPKLSRNTLRSVVKKMQHPVPQALEGRDGSVATKYYNGKVYLFADEFTNFMEAELGATFVRLLNKLGYEVVIPKHFESGRAALSKGMLRLARKFAFKNVDVLKDIVTEEHPLIGIEPSCILSFRDEYPALLRGDMAVAANKLAKNCLLFDEFIMREVNAGKISYESFTISKAEIWLHGHCHQKSLVGTALTEAMLNLPVNYNVHIIPSGCCGMAGSYGYEKEHYKSSMEIGEEILFPAVRKVQKMQQDATTEGNTCKYIVAAPGTSCREQILDGTGVQALHPIEVLYNALK